MAGGTVHVLGRCSMTLPKKFFLLTVINDNAPPTVHDSKQRQTHALQIVWKVYEVYDIDWVDN